MGLIERWLKECEATDLSDIFTVYMGLIERWLKECDRSRGQIYSVHGID
jgi:hypothetical protein